MRATKSKLLAFVLSAAMVLALPGTVFAADVSVPETSACILTEGCTLTEGHEGECILVPQKEDDIPEVCTQTEGCVLQAGHEGECRTEDAADVGEAFQACTLTDGCVLEADHDGACVTEKPSDEETETMCTLTEGCTLKADHAGACITEAENSDGVSPAADNTENAARLPVVYYGGTKGNDDNTGADEKNAVRTLEKALELVTEGGTVMVCAPIYTNDDVVIENVTLKRAGGFAGKLLYVNTGSLTLKDVTIDGSKDTISATDYSALINFTQKNTTLNINEGTRLINNGAMAVYVNDGQTVNMTGGVISGNESQTDGGGIFVQGGTVNLNGGEITANQSERCGGGICVLGTGSIYLNGTSVSGNSAVCGGGIYLEGRGGSATLVMQGGEITGNSLTANTDGTDYWVADGAGICGFGGNAVIDIQGGTIANNNVSVEGVGDGAGSAVSLNNGDGLSFPVLKLSGSPMISGDVFLWDEDSTGPVIEAAADLACAAPIEINANYRTTGTVAVRFPEGTDAVGKESLFTTEDEMTMLLGDEHELAWGETIRVVFNSPDNRDTYKKIYIRPDSAIDPSQAPTVEGGEVTPPAGYILSGWREYGEQDFWDFETKISDRKTLLAVWGLDTPSITVDQDKESAHVGEQITLTASAGHQVKDAVFSYQWYKDGNKLNGETNSVLTVTESGSYTVKVSASDGKLTSAEVESEAVNCTITDHSYSSAWTTDGTNHWHECTVCGVKKDSAAHSGGKATCESQALCEVCGAAYGALNPDNHTGKTEVRGDKAATCTAEGYTGDTYCAGCGEKLALGIVLPKIDHTFGEWTVTKEPTETATGEKERICSGCGAIDKAEIPVLGHTHSYGKDWKSDADNHWHECDCGEKADVAAHIYGDWTITKAATATEAGSREKYCTVCDYKVTESIPAAGTITTPTATPSPTAVPENGGSKGPQTGDTNQLLLWAGLFTVTGAGLLSALFYKLKGKNSK